MVMHRRSSMLTDSRWYEVVEVGHKSAGSAHNSVRRACTSGQVDKVKRRRSSVLTTSVEGYIMARASQA